MNKAESCVETPAAPEWLSKLESRREKLTRGKLGHESGAGAPCNECKSGCPGLDLHFWRKVCRNCKCRKDQHMCPEDDLSGWAQFEILGQIRSKPAYIKIKALADNPIKLEWIPPNAEHDVVSDYMSKLGSEHIPIEGSSAAVKRKQQLEFQVPPHDLDAELCDNLTESEMSQLKQYVQKIRENCVGQGSVIRIGNVGHANVMNLAEQVEENQYAGVTEKFPPPEVMRKLKATPAQIIKDKFLTKLLNSEQLKQAILMEPAMCLRNNLVAFQRPLSPNFENTPLSDKNKNKLQNMNMNLESVRSVVSNGPIYDNILNELKLKNVDITQDPILQPIETFRKDYLEDKNFQKDIDDFIEFLDKIMPQYGTPVKGNQPISQDVEFMSPLPLRNPVSTRFGSHMMQDTPMRKVKFGEATNSSNLGIPEECAIERDPILSKIVNSEPLHVALQYPSQVLRNNKGVVVLNRPMTPDLAHEQCLSAPTRHILEKIGVNKKAVQSGIVNAPVYEKLFGSLSKKHIRFPECKLLEPMDEFRAELAQNAPFQREIVDYVYALPDSHEIYCSEPLMNSAAAIQSNCASPIKFQDKPGFLSNPQSPFKGNIHESKSSDSGFDSEPPTPNYSTFPAIGTMPGVKPLNSAQYGDSRNVFEVGANPGKLTSIPALEDMYMYPQVHPTTKNVSHALGAVNAEFDKLHVGGGIREPEVHRIVPVVKCKDCGKDIMSGDVAVKAERAGKEVAWHPQCFVCHKCRELLADLVYFFHNGNVYCGRDLADILKIPRCNACDELIFTKEYTAAENATFHIKHFCCYHCDTPLAGQQYTPDEKTNMPLCLQCYDEFYAERCQRCKNVIGPAEQGVSWGKIHWHGPCFRCAGLGCDKSLIGGRFCVKNDAPFCSAQCVKSVLLN